MDLEKIIQQKLEKIIDSGIVEKKIEEVLIETIDSAIKSSFSKYSEFERALSKKISKSFEIDLDNISIPEYGSVMLGYITDEIETHLKYETSVLLKERINNFFTPISKKEYTVSEIVELYKNNIEYLFTDDYDQIPESHEITAFVEQDNCNNYFELYLSSEPNVSKYDCEFHIRMNTNEGIWHITTNSHGRNFKLHKTRTHFLNSFEKLIFKLYSQKIKIINDSENIDKYIASSI